MQERGLLASPCPVPESHEIFETFPGRFFGLVGIDPNLGMKSVLAARRAVNSHPAIRSLSSAPCLSSPQVAIDSPLMYPFYALCCELDVPMNILAGVPGPRVPFDCQHVERVDRVCCDFPDLRLVLRHGCEPWADLAVMFAGYYPGLSWERVLGGLDNVPSRDHVWEPFLAGNAKRVFGL